MIDESSNSLKPCNVGARYSFNPPRPWQSYLGPLRHRCLILAAVSIVLTLPLYAQILLDWMRELETDPSYSFALLLPFVAGYLGYRRIEADRHSLAAPLRCPDPAGIPVVLGGCALLVIGDLTTIVFLSRLSFLIVSAGFIITLLGRHAMRSLAFPFGLLFLALPLPALVYLPLTFQLQLLSSVLAAHMLQAAGISVLREGNLLILHHTVLEVAEACAGLHSLFALSALACIISYLFLHGPLRRILLILSAIPVAIGLNAARITSAAVAVNFWGPEASEGFVHASIGVVVFTIGSLMMLFISRGLARPQGGADAVARAPGSSGEPAAAASEIPLWAVIVIVLVTLAIHCRGLRTVQAEPLRDQLAYFPRDIKDWHGRDLTLTDRQFSSLGTHDVLMRDYQDHQHEAPVLFHVAFYSRQQQGSTMHSPLHCIPGSGWEVERRRLIPLQLSKAAPPFDANEVVFQRENSRILVLYWYLEQGTPQASELKGALHTMWSSATSGRSFGCLIRFSTPITTNTQDALTRASAFATVALPILMERFLPAQDAAKSAAPRPRHLSFLKIRPQVLLAYQIAPGLSYPPGRARSQEAHRHSCVD